MNSGKLKTSVLLLLLPIFIGVMEVEDFGKTKKDNLQGINGSWEWVGSFSGVTRYRVYPEKGKKRFFEAIKNNVLVFAEDGRILTSGEISKDTVTFRMKDDVELQKTYEIRNDSLFLEELTSSKASANPVLSVYVRMSRP